MEFAQQLAQMRFGEMWSWPAHDETVAAIWDEGDNAPRLDAIVDSAEAPPKARFVACEVLGAEDPFYMQRHPPAQVAQIYATALAGDFTGRANSWGLLYEEQDEGPVGVVFLAIGADAIPALAPLLDDDRRIHEYEGSEEATVGNAYGYRVKDFAAYYIGRIQGQPLAWHPEVADRDAQIEALKARL